MSPKNKKKRIIRVKHPQLQKFRTAMRELLKNAQTTERRGLREFSNFGLGIEKENEVERQIEELDRARRHAPIGCRVCGRQDLDLVFNPSSSQWYCEGCYTFNQEAYKKNPHPYEPDWRKIFP